MVHMDANGIVLATENHDVVFFGHEHQEFFQKHQHCVCQHLFVIHRLVFWRDVRPLVCYSTFFHNLGLGAVELFVLSS